MRRTSWPVSRILFPAAAHRQRRRGGDHPSGHTVTGCLERPTRRLGRAALERLRGRTRGCGLLGLASGGVCLATPVTRDAGALLPHRFTLTTARVAVCFLWHFPASHLGLPLAITLLCEVRTFLEPPCDGPRPPGQLVRDEPRYYLRHAGASNARRAGTIAGSILWTQTDIGARCPLEEARRHRRLGHHRHHGRRVRRGAAAAAGHARRSGPAAQALCRRRPVPVDHRHGAQTLWRRAVPLFPRALPRTDRAAQAGALPLPAADSSRLVGQARPGRTMAGQPRRLAGGLSRRRTDQIDRPDAEIRGGRLECFAPGSVR